MVVLIVDDDEACRRMLEMYLGLAIHRDEHEIHVAPSAVGIVERARDCQPDIILMDVAMPKVDGFEALEALKADERTAAIPVVIMSARCTREDDFERALRLGAATYVTKPFKIFGLAGMLEGHIQEAKKKARDGPGLRNPNLKKGASNAKEKFTTS